MIKFTTRPNMKYLVNLIIWSYVRDIILDVTTYLFHFSVTIIYLILSFLGEFIFGGITYLYQKRYKKRKNLTKNDTFLTIHLIINDKLKRSDSKWKIYFLIFIAGFSDFVDSILFLGLAPGLDRCSDSIENRMRGILIIFDALFYLFVLRLQIFKHQFFSIYVISICLIITIIIEFIFQDINIFLSYGKFVLLIFLIIIQILFNSLVDSIEKYLFEYNYVNPFKVLMIEGLVGLVFSFIYCFCYNPIPELKKFYEYDQNNKKILFPYLILLLLLILILYGVQNIFRVVTNKVYSPMALALAQYFLNPIYIIFTLIVEKDFESKRGNTYLFFSLNLILTIIISLCGCVYNEFIILFFCGLQHETYKEISFRAALPDSEIDLDNINDCDEEDSL